MDEERGSCVGGGSGFGPGVRSKCVIVTKLTRKSRGGQCADRTLGCMIHRRSLNTNSVKLPITSLLSACIMEPVKQFPITPVASSVTCVPVNNVKQKQEQLGKIVFPTLFFISRIQGEKNLHMAEIRQKPLPDKTFQQMSVNMCNMI